MDFPKIGDRDPFAPAPEGEPPRDDPFARATPQLAEPGRAAAADIEVTPSLFAPLARRDPHAPAEDSAEYGITGAASFDDVLRRARRQGFLRGSVVGALAAGALAGALALVGSRPAPGLAGPTAGSPAEAARASDALPGRREVTLGVPAASATPPATSSGEASPLASQDPAPPEAPPPRRRRATAPAPPPDAALPDAPRPAAAGAPAAGAAGSPSADAASVAEPLDAPRGLDEAELAAALSARRDAIDACVAATTGDGDPPRGHRFRLLVAIEPSGRVSEAQIDDPEVQAAPLGVCLVRIARAMSFAPFDGEPVQVELPFRYGDSDRD